MPQVSVIIPCYDAAGFIRETLGSVESQKGVSLEIIVVDDGSKDEGPEIVEREFPGVRLIRTPNQGPAAARNTGTRAAQGDFLQYLDADDLLGPEKIPRQCAALESSGGDIAYGRWQKLVKNAGGYEEEAGPDQRLSRRPEIDIFTRFWCPPAAYLFRRSIVEKAGDWAERFPVIQDARFVLDCALKGGRFVFCEGIAAYYRVHSAASVSRRDPAQFLRDRWVNAGEIEAYWKGNGGVDAERLDALLNVYEGVARAAYPVDKALFASSHAALERLRPGFRPARPLALAVASRVLGYPAAEGLALAFRNAKKRIGRR